jgi:hypothetical protein
LGNASTFPIALLYCILAAIIKDEKVNPIYALKLQQHSKVE